MYAQDKIIAVANMATSRAVRQEGGERKREGQGAKEREHEEGSEKEEGQGAKGRARGGAEREEFRF